MTKTFILFLKPEKQKNMNDYCVVDEIAKKAALARMEKSKKKEERWGKVTVTSVKDGTNTIITITGNYFAEGMVDALGAVHSDICNCGCQSCEKGCHADCESDGQSCYPKGHHRVNDGIHRGKVV
jgi:hypothetical protein